MASDNPHCKVITLSHAFALNRAHDILLRWQLISFAEFSCQSAD